jgi:O-methyltransferase involved in polyketide biosynthesis
MGRLAVELDPVPETLLWTLYHRATEARRPDAVLRDPLAVELVERIAFPFEERFGSGAAFSQWQALRARCFDSAVARFLANHPAGTVVALGEGLETQFWRVDNGRVRWLTVDLPEVVELRSRLLPDEARVHAIGCSALDPRWLTELQDESGVLITAQGLLMYLSPDEVRSLVARCGDRFRGGGLVFDVVPRWLVERSRRGLLKTSAGYEPPAWSWGFDRDEEQRLRALPHVAGLQALRLPRGRGLLHGAVLPAAGRVAAVRRLQLSVLAARFAV